MTDVELNCVSFERQIESMFKPSATPKGALRLRMRVKTEGAIADPRELLDSDD